MYNRFFLLIDITTKTHDFTTVPPISQYCNTILSQTSRSFKLLMHRTGKIKNRTNFVANKCGDTKIAMVIFFFIRDHIMQYWVKCTCLITELSFPIIIVLSLFWILNWFFFRFDFDSSLLVLRKQKKYVKIRKLI